MPLLKIFLYAMNAGNITVWNDRGKMKRAFIIQSITFLDIFPSWFLQVHSKPFVCIC